MNKLNEKAKWVFFFKSMAWLFGVWIVLTTMGFSEIYIERNNFTLFISGVLFVAISFIIGSYIWSVLSHKFYFYDLQDQGFKKEHGVIYKKYVTIPYGRIQNVDIHRGIVDRLLGLSSIKIQTAGAISHGSYGMSSEGYLPGISKDKAEELRDELIKRANMSSRQNTGEI